MTHVQATLRDALHTATRSLAAASPSPRLDAEWLLAHVTAMSRAQIRARDEQRLDEATATRYDQLVERRRRGEPIAYIIGEWEFWSLRLEISPAVLIPRPETELLVELALDRLPVDRSVDVLDLGTGSGAIAIAIATERPLAHLTAVDRSGAALTIARRNIARHVPGGIELIEGSWFERLAGRRFDLIVANPPYVASDDPALAPAVAAYEPATALLAGRTGLDAIEAIVAVAPDHLTRDGQLLLEHGARQGAAVRHALCAAGFADVTSVCDLAGHERVTGGRRGAASTAHGPQGSSGGA